MIGTFFAAIHDPCTLEGAGSHSFLSFPHWWQFLDGEKDGLGTCVPKFHAFGPSGFHDVFAVGLAILDIMLRVAGVIVVAYIIIAGIQYMLSTGNPEKVSNSLTRIINASIGLAIVLTATAIVAFIGNTFK